MTQLHPCLCAWLQCVRMAHYGDIDYLSIFLKKDCTRKSKLRRLTFWRKWKRAPVVYFSRRSSVVWTSKLYVLWIVDLSASKPPSNKIISYWETFKMKETHVRKVDHDLLEIASILLHEICICLSVGNKKRYYAGKFLQFSFHLQPSASVIENIFSRHKTKWPSF